MIKFNTVHNYVALTRSEIDGQRKYLTPDGQHLASVTTILDRTKSEESKEGLANWRRSVGHKKAQEITETAAARGTRMHTYLEKYIKQEPFDRPTNPMALPSWRMAHKVIEHGLCNVEEIWGVEVAVYYEGLYAGTTDSIGVWRGRPAIVDYKQSNKVKKREWIDDYFTQLTFYGTAHNKMFGTDINTGVIMMCVAPATSRHEPQYLEFVLEGDEWAHYQQKMWDRVAQFYNV